MGHSGYTKNYTYPYQGKLFRRNIVEWYDDYSIHVELIDNQHKELVKVVTRLQQSLSSSAANAEIGEALKFLVQYTQQHFKDEEKLMAAINFAEINSHKKKHAKLIDDVKNILLDLKKGKTIHPYELIDYLTEWLIKHIRNEDKRIGRAMEQYKSEHNDWDGSFI